MIELLLIRGLPGSGKTTLANILKKDNEYAHHEADHYFEDSLGNYFFDRNKIEEAHFYCQTKVEEELSEGKSCIVSNTFCKEWEIVPYRKLAEKYDADLKIIVLTENYGSIHNVPQEAIDRMKSNWETITE